MRIRSPQFVGSSDLDRATTFRRSLTPWAPARAASPRSVGPRVTAMGRDDDRVVVLDSHSERSKFRFSGPEGGAVLRSRSKRRYAPPRDVRPPPARFVMVRASLSTSWFDQAEGLSRTMAMRSNALAPSSRRPQARRYRGAISESCWMRRRGAVPSVGESKPPTMRVVGRGTESGSMPKHTGGR